jgi:hypothetical protein
MAPPLVVPKSFEHKFFFKSCFIDPSNVASINIELNDVVIVLTQIEADLANNKKVKKNYELNCCFQESWLTKFPWEKFVEGVDGKVT